MIMLNSFQREIWAADDSQQDAAFDDADGDGVAGGSGGVVDIAFMQELAPPPAVGSLTTAGAPRLAATPSSAR